MRILLLQPLPNDFHVGVLTQTRVKHTLAATGTENDLKTDLQAPASSPQTTSPEAQTRMTDRTEFRSDPRLQVQIRTA